MLFVRPTLQVDTRFSLFLSIQEHSTNNSLLSPLHYQFPPLDHSQQQIKMLLFCPSKNVVISLPTQLTIPFLCSPLQQAKLKRIVYNLFLKPLLSSFLKHPNQAFSFSPLPQKLLLPRSLLNPADNFQY